MKSDESKSEDEQSGRTHKEQVEQRQSLSSLLNSPYDKCQNIKDLKMLDLNSADEVRYAYEDENPQRVAKIFAEDFPQTQRTRQVMKSILGGKGPHNNDVDEKLVASVNVDDFKALSTTGADSSHVKNIIIQTDIPNSRRHTKKTVLRSRDRLNNSRRRRPGRPPKAGPSRSVEKKQITAMYVGKLSNVSVCLKKRTLPKRLR